MTLHDELRELVDTYGQGLLGDADLFRAALDDYLPENAALPGQLNVLHDAVRFGAYARCVELLSRGSEPMLAVSTAGDLLARERGTTEVITSRWAVASLAHATGHLATDALSVFLQPDTAGGPLRDPAPSVPVPPGPPSDGGPPGPPPSYPPPQSIPPPPSVSPPTANPAPPLPPTYLPPVEAATGSPPSWPASEQPEPAQTSAPVLPPTTSDPVPEDPAGASSTPVQPQTVPAPLGRSAVPGPPGAARKEPRWRSRRAGLLTAAAVSAALAAGVVAYLVVADGDDDAPGPTAIDSATSGAASSPTTSGGSTPSTPLSAPDAPKLGAAPAYRSVAFTVKGGVVGQQNVRLERWSDDGWTETDPEFAVPTDEGGERACARVRAVRAEGDQRAAGPVARLCATSKPRTIEMVRSDAGCPPDAPESSLACYAFDLSVAGFEPSKAEMRIIGATYQGTYQACERKCTKQVPLDASGRGQLKGAMYAFDGQIVTVEVDGVRETVAVG